MKKDKIKVWKALMVSEEVRDKIVMLAKAKKLTVSEYLYKKIK